MGAGVVIAITAIVQIILSFVPLVVNIFFPDSLYSPVMGAFSVIMALISFFMIFLLVLFIFQDKDTNNQQKIIGLVFVIILSGVGALIYLFIRAKNRGISGNSNPVPKVLFGGEKHSSFVFTPASEVVDLINSPSFSKVSESNKKLILNMQRSTPLEKTKEWQIGVKDESNIAYYRNGKPVYKSEIKSHSKI